MFNMFVMKRDAFDSYCEFIFGVLKDVESRVDIADYSVQEKRVFGYIFELFGLILQNKNILKLNGNS